MIAKHCPVKPEVKPVVNRPPLNMLSNTLDVITWMYTASEALYVIAKHFLVAVGTTCAKTSTTWTTTRPDCVELAWKNRS